MTRWRRYSSRTGDDAAGLAEQNRSREPLQHSFGGAAQGTADAPRASMYAMGAVRSLLIVAQHLYPRSSGGTARFIYDYARHLARQRLAVTIVLPKVDARCRAREEIEGVTVFRFGGRFYFACRRVFPRALLDAAWSVLWTRWLLARDSFDVVSFHHPLVAFVCLLLPRVRCGYWHYHFYASIYQEMSFDRPQRNQVWPLFTWLGWQVERVVYRWAPRIIVLSGFTRDILVEEFGVNQAKIKLIPGAVDTEQFRPTRETSVEMIWPSGCLRLLSVRRLEQRMGLEILIKAVANLRARGLDVFLVIAGKGRLRKKLERLIEAEHLMDGVRLLGFVPDEKLAELYSSADVFVLPTIALEGFGLVTVESLACGTPVIASTVGATPEILAKMDPRFLVDAITVERLAERLEWFVRLGKDERHRWSRRGHAVVAEHYAWAQVAHAYLDLYDEVGRAPSPASVSTVGQ
jgi:glycosyltransferase involved in cell wall biosynthesis